MSKKTKTTKVVGVPTSPLTDFSMPVKNMDETYGSPGTPMFMGRGDPLAQVEAEEAREAYDELKQLKARKKRLEVQKRIESMKEELDVDTSGGGLKLKGMFNFSPQDIQALSKMPEEDQRAYIDTMRKLGAIASMAGAGGRKGQEANALLQLIAMGGFGGGQQGLGLKDIMQLQQMWSTIYQGAGGRQNELTNTLLIKLLTETMPSLQNQAINSMQMAYGAQIAQLQANQADPLRDIKFVKELGQEMGWRPGSMSDTVALKTLEMQNLWKQKEWELRRDELQSRKTLGTLQQILQQVNVPAIMRGVMRRETAGAMGSRQQVQQPQTVAAPPQPQMQGTFGLGTEPKGRVRILDYQCPYGCGATVSAIEGTEILTCPNCGGQFRTKEGAQ